MSSPTMPTGDATNTSCTDAGRKRTRFAAVPSDALLTANVSTAPMGLSPSAAAKACSKAAVASLHHLLRPHLQDHAEKFILAFSTWYYKFEKLKKMKNDTAFIPSPAKVGLTLEPFDDVRKSEEYNALATRLASAVSTCQREFRDILVACTELNVASLKRNIQKSFAIALPTIAEGFLALDNVKNYTKHQVVADLLDRHQDEIFSHLNVTRTDFIEIYKEVHGASALPLAPEIPPAPPAQQQQPPNPQVATTNTATPNNHANPVTPQTGARILINLEGEGFQFIPNPYNRINGSPPGVFVNNNNNNNTAPTTTTVVVAAPTTPVNNLTNAAIRTINQPADNLQIEGLNEPDGVNPLFDYGLNDENMEDTSATNNNNSAINDSTITIIGARESILNQVRSIVCRAFIASTESFVRQVSINETNARVKKATTKQALEETADKVVQLLENEGSVDPSVLKGLINQEAKKQTTELNRRIQSLEAKLAREPKSNTNKNKSKKNERSGARNIKGAASPNKSSRSNTNRSSAPPSRGRAGAANKGSQGDTSASSKRPSENKSKKKNNQSKTKRSNSSGPSCRR